MIVYQGGNHLKVVSRVEEFLGDRLLSREEKSHRGFAEAVSFKSRDHG